MDFKVTGTGFILDRLWHEGKTVTLSKQYLDEFKAKYKKEFTASWLEPIVKASTAK